MSLITRTLPLLFAAILVSSPPVSSRAWGDELMYGVISNAASEDESKAAEAIARIRSVGPAGLQLLLEYHDGQCGQEEVDAAHVARIRAAIDRVAAQKDAHASRLFWHTNLEAAKAAARESKKPILSLRMLGNLDEDLSCANSRFFRTALYANAEVGKLLREGFVLHWRSVRPVPVITIDMGDGRTICRTITGNSAHYVLTPEGRPVDALPGLYGPKAFLRGLAQARAIAMDVAAAAPEHRDGLITSHHAALKRNVEAAWGADLLTTGHAFELAETRTTDARPDAADAAPVAASKFVSEAPFVRAVMPADALREATDDDARTAIAKLHADDARLDEASIGLMREKVAPEALQPAMVERFERSMAIDTVRNEYDLHRRIHAWFAAGEVGPDVEALNERVYAELFLTPSSDPWLGLVPDATYVALDASGLR